MTSNPNIFEKYGCVMIKNFLDPITVRTISMYLQNKMRREEWMPAPQSDITMFQYYADPLIETVLETSLQVVEKECGKELYPTYSFARIYQPGEQLKVHTDRPSCEISVTVNVASKGTQSPIWMHYDNNEPISFVLSPGDAIIYKGCEAKHWRDILKPDQLNVQFMLHYVDKFGPYSNFKYDQRPSLGFSSIRRI